MDSGTRTKAEAYIAQRRAEFNALPAHTRWAMMLSSVDSALGTGPCEKVEKTCDWCSESYRFAVETLKELCEEIAAVKEA